MIEYTITNPSFFINSIDSISSIVDEGVIEFDNYIKLKGMDGGRLVFFELLIGEDSLLIKKKGYEEVPLFICDLIKILKRFKGKMETITLLYDNNVLTIRGKINNKDKTFKLRAIDIDYEGKDLSIEKLLSLPLDAIFKTKRSDILDAIEDCEIYGEWFDIETKGTLINIYADGPIGEALNTIELTTEIYSNQKANYSIKFAKPILKSLYNEDVIIMFRKDYPMAIHDRISEKSKMVWFIAPRVENEDD